MAGRRLLEVSASAPDLGRLGRDLRSVPDKKLLTKRLRRNLRSAADPIKQQVQSNASWSSRIPGAVTVGTTLTGKNAGVSIKVNAKKAPHARPLENRGKVGTFQHRVYGHDVWVSQPARLFFFGETARHMPAVLRAVDAAVQETARAIGFR